MPTIADLNLSHLKNPSEQVLAFAHFARNPTQEPPNQDVIAAAIEEIFSPECQSPQIKKNASTLAALLIPHPVGCTIARSMADAMLGYVKHYRNRFTDYSNPMPFNSFFVQAFETQSLDITFFESFDLSALIQHTSLNNVDRFIRGINNTFSDPAVMRDLVIKFWQAIPEVDLAGIENSFYDIRSCSIDSCLSCHPRVLFNSPETMIPPLLDCIKWGEDKFSQHPALTVLLNRMHESCDTSENLETSVQLVSDFLCDNQHDLIARFDTQYVGLLQKIIYLSDPKSTDSLHTFREKTFTQLEEFIADRLHLAQEQMLRPKHIPALTHACLTITSNPSRLSEEKLLKMWEQTISAISETLQEPYRSTELWNVCIRGLSTAPQENIKLRKMLLQEATCSLSDMADKGSETSNIFFNRLTILLDDREKFSPDEMWEILSSLTLNFFSIASLPRGCEGIIRGINLFHPSENLMAREVKSLTFSRPEQDDGLLKPFFLVATPPANLWTVGFISNERIVICDDCSSETNRLDHADLDEEGRPSRKFGESINKTKEGVIRNILREKNIGNDELVDLTEQHYRAVERAIASTLESAIEPAAPLVSELKRPFFSAWFTQLQPFS